MALFNINDINLEILSWIIDFKLFVNLSILDKKSYILITDTPVYIELDKLKNNKVKLWLGADNMFVIDIYYRLGLINILKKLKKNNKYYISNRGMDWASRNGHIDILEWYKNSELNFRHTENAINYASGNGHINILRWFKNSGFEFKYTDYAIDWASENGHINILEWFKNSGFEFKYTDYAIDWASENGYVNVLEWFKNSGFELKYSTRAIDWASENGYVNVLEW